jgi:lysylphosphatidylglycerol synthetase-like protein (DUF2156 family)
MSENPYVAPNATLITQVEIPAQVRADIKNAWIAAVISGSLTLVITMISIYGTSIAGMDAWNLIDVVLIFGLAVGIYRNSRVCATAMFVYFVISKIIGWVDAGKPTGLILAVIFIYYFFKGMVATFDYHKAMKAQG